MKLMFVMIAVLTTITVLANPPNPRVEGDMFAVKKVAGTPNYATLPR